MKKNKILFVTPNFHQGGAERNILNIINSLDTELFDVKLCICGAKNDYLKYIESEKVEIIQLNKETVKSSLRELVRIIRNVKPDIVFSSSVHLSFFVSLIKFLFFTIRFKNIVRIPSLLSNNLNNTWKSRIIGSFISFTFQKADVIISQTHEMKEEVDVLLKESNKSIVIHNIVNLEGITDLSNEYCVNFDEDYYNIVAAGSLYSVKGFDLLIYGFKKLQEAKTNVRLYILGGESIELGYSKYLLTIIHELNLKESVFLTGFVSNPYPYFRKANLFVLSSLKEGFPNVVLEALVLNTPVVVTDCVNFDFVIDDTNGVIVKKNDKDALYHGMLKAIDIKSFEFNYRNYNYNRLFLDIL